MFKGVLKMGQAKKRGAYEQRRAEAILRDAADLARRAEIARRRSSPKLSRHLAYALAMRESYISALERVQNK
jgi:hypothetical protein